MASDDVDTTLETVLLGPLLAGRLRYWSADGTPHLAMVDGGGAAAMARGVLARTSPEPQRFREVALHDGAATLVLVDRPMGSDPSSVTTGGQPVVVRDSGDVVVDDALWSAAATWWRDAYISAAGRGEFVVVEPGGWTPGSVPFAFAMARPFGDGTWHTFLEAAPAPTGSLWPASNEAGTTVNAPVTPGNLEVVGLMLADAVRGWAASPFDTVVTYGTNPDGALPSS